MRANALRWRRVRPAQGYNGGQHDETKASKPERGGRRGQTGGQAQTMSASVKTRQGHRVLFQMSKDALGRLGER